MSTKLYIVIPFENAEELWNLWAFEEKKIDFRKEKKLAERCTLAFAAYELKHFLDKSDPDIDISVVEKPPVNAKFIELQIFDEQNGAAFELIPCQQGITLLGYGRNGIINAAYELLRLRGWRWLEPGPYGESPPEDKSFNWPLEKIKYKPSFYYRAMDAYRTSNDSKTLLLWMARNRCNVYFRKEATAALCDKLAMYSRYGGHLLQKMLQPDNLLPNGKNIWEGHREWFGKVNGKLISKKLATDTQLCLAHDSLFEYLADELAELLKTELSGIDILDLWSFDTWGKTCACEFCQNLGSGSDQHLYLLAKIREKLEKKLDRKVLLDGVIYEGTVSMDAPTREIPEILRKAGDIMINYPIKRCYRHSIADKTCEINKLYAETINAWTKESNELSIWIGEYYNVSRFEDLPLLFKSILPGEMRFYHKAKMNGATFMHDFPIAWGVRMLTKLQHAQYAWDVNTKDNDFLKEYYHRKYGKYAAEMEKVYDDVEEAFIDISALRNYGKETLTNFLNNWDGKIPSKELKVFHFDRQEDLLISLEKTVFLLRKAVNKLQELLIKERAINWQDLRPEVKEIAHLSPQELEAMQYFDKMEYHLGEDLRGLIYGLNSARFMLAFSNYYAALYNRNEGETEWQKLEKVAAEMATRYAPISFELETGIICKDELSRTLLSRALTRCRKARAEK